MGSGSQVAILDISHRGSIDCVARPVRSTLFNTAIDSRRVTLDGKRLVACTEAYGISGIISMEGKSPNLLYV